MSEGWQHLGLSPVPQPACCELKDRKAASSFSPNAGQMQTGPVPRGSTDTGMLKGRQHLESVSVPQSGNVKMG